MCLPLPTGSPTFFICKWQASFLEADTRRDLSSPWTFGSRWKDFPPRRGCLLASPDGEGKVLPLLCGHLSGFQMEVLPAEVVARCRPWAVSWMTVHVLPAQGRLVSVTGGAHQGLDGRSNTSRTAKATGEGAPGRTAPFLPAASPHSRDQDPGWAPRDWNYSSFEPENPHSVLKDLCTWVYQVE